MVAQQQNEMIRTLWQGMEYILGGAIGISMLDLTLIALNQTAALDIVIAKWLQILFTAVGIIYFIASWPHKRKMQKLEREMKEEELKKLQAENKNK